MRPLENIHPQLPPLRLANSRSEEYTGACPFCGGDEGSDRFHVWMTASGNRPARRFWCRNCGEKGLIDRRFHEGLSNNAGTYAPQVARLATERPESKRQRTEPSTAHIPQYRQLYALVALWAHANLFDPANPDPLAYIFKRGLSEQATQRHLLGYGMLDPQALPTYLTQDAAELLPYAEEAGLLLRDWSGALRAHPNLCGAITFPYIANSEVIDIRMRRPGAGHKTKSLPGSYTERGATLPMGWDTLDGADSILITESGEFKALLPQATYEIGRLSIPTLGHPGLTNFRPEWGQQLHAHGVRSVILAYDTQPRPVRDGLLQLAPEEAATIRHGQHLVAAGLEVRVLRLPLAPGEKKADLDEFLLHHSPERLQALIDTAPLLYDYHRALPLSLVEQAKLPIQNTYPTHRSRPRKHTDTARAEVPNKQTITLEKAREDIAEQVYQHITHGQGFLVLAHPPGTGKGHNTAKALAAYRQAHPDSGKIIWTAPRKDQHQDQQELPLIPLHGRGPQNCRKAAEAQILSGKSYNVRQTLCERRCPHISYCRYLRQFSQDGDFFAPIPLLQASQWWADASMIVLDEFDPARLTRTIEINLTDLGAMAKATICPYARSVLRWLGQVLSSTLDRVLSGTLLYAELEQTALTEGLGFWATVRQAIAALPPPEDQALLPGFPSQATLKDYENLPPGHLVTLLEQMAREERKGMSGKHYTSRIEAKRGILQLYLRIDHLIEQLANPAQPKIILDATANEALLRAIFPQTPVRIEQPAITGTIHVVQEITRDWAKSTLHNKHRERWYDTVAAHIRPDRKTLVVCTLDCEHDLRQALAARGHHNVELAHYGAVRGTNAYVGYDVVLAQIYHPNSAQIIREGRALFADDGDPLDERFITAERILTDATGDSWTIQVPTFADPRLAALLENRREHELVQAALRGRPLDHPDAQITLLFSLPLPGLQPTRITEATTAPTSNAGRKATAQEALLTAARQLLESGKRQIDVQELASRAGVSVVTVRTHWNYIAQQLKLKQFSQRRLLKQPNGTKRSYTRAILVLRGRIVRTRKQSEKPPPEPSTDQADNYEDLNRLICPLPRGEHSSGYRCRRAVLTCPRFIRSSDQRIRSPRASPRVGECVSAVLRE